MNLILVFCMAREKEFYAFISYKREDKKEAKRLQHALKIKGLFDSLYDVQ